ncbi:MAG: hypothetical protein H0V17_14080 [Deltaproteobacteria bacterium]|nr:hypothetical protein [Deltaproteobacteria bacterium]
MFVLSSEAAAQPKKPTADDIKKAETHFDRGEEFRKFGNFEEAIREYLAGYELTGSAEFLFNVGQAYREKGDKRMAVGYYKKYLTLDPSGDGVLFAKSHIEVLEKEIRDEEAASAARKQREQEAEAKRKAEAEAARNASELTAKREADIAAKTKVSESEGRRRITTARYLRFGGIGVAAAGVVAAGVSVYFGRRASSLSDEASREAIEMGTWTDELEDKVDDAESAQTKMYILLGSAGVAVIGGGVLYYVGTRMQRPVERRVVVTPVRGGIGLAVGGRF